MDAVELHELHEHLIVVASELLLRYTADTQNRPQVELATSQGASLALLCIAPRSAGQAWHFEVQLVHQAGSVLPIGALRDSGLTADQKH